MKVFNFLIRLITSIVISVFTIPLSLIIAIFATILIIISLLVKLYDIINKDSDISSKITEFSLVGYGMSLFLISIPIYVVLENS